MARYIGNKSLVAPVKGENSRSASPLSVNQSPLTPITSPSSGCRDTPVAEGRSSISPKNDVQAIFLRGFTPLAGRLSSQELQHLISQVQIEVTSGFQERNGERTSPVQSLLDITDPHRFRVSELERSLHPRRCSPSRTRQVVSKAASEAVVKTEISCRALLEEEEARCFDRMSFGAKLVVRNRCRGSS